MTEELKRSVSLLIPYKIENGKIFVYLQKRTTDAERSPGLFGLFGGGVEAGETAEEGLIREIKEELGYALEEYTFFKTSETAKSVQSVFYTAVPADFEQKVTVLEGEYGKYFSEAEVRAEQALIAADKATLEDFFNAIAV